MSILTKIAKLLKLAENNPSEAERTLAAEKVQFLLQEHGLTLAQVEAADPNAIATVKREKVTTDHRAMYEWQRKLMATLAASNFCLHAIQKTFAADSGWGKRTRLVDGKRVNGHIERRHVLVGRELNVSVTRLTYDYLTTAIRQEAKAAGHSHPLAQTTTWFIEGAVSRLIERLEQRRKEAEAASHANNQPTPANINGTHRELVLSDVYGSEADLNNDTLNNFPPGTTATNRRKTEARRAAQQAEHDRLVAEGIDDAKAWYLAYGYGEQEAAQAATRWNHRQRNGGRGRTNNWTRGHEQHYRKINSEEYQADRAAGSNIGLDTQVTTNTTRRLGQ